MFTLKTVIFSIFRWYFRNFVGTTNDILAGSHVPTKLRKALLGGGGAMGGNSPRLR